MMNVALTITLVTSTFTEVLTFTVDEWSKEQPLVLMDEQIRPKLLSLLADADAKFRQQQHSLELELTASNSNVSNSDA